MSTGLHWLEVVGFCLTHEFISYLEELEEIHGHRGQLHLHPRVPNPFQRDTNLLQVIVILVQ